MDDLELYNEFIRKKMQTLGILIGKDVTVDGCWLGTSHAIHIEGVKGEYLKVNLEVLVDDDGLDRLKEYAKIVQIFEGDDDGQNH
jgi:hypothetical protein